VEFIAEAISTLGAQRPEGLGEFHTYHVMNPYDDGIGMDEFVDGLIDDGNAIARIGDYGEWLQRFETILRGLPEKQRNSSLLVVVAQLPKAREAVAAVAGTHRPVPCGRPGRESRLGQRHSAHLAADHHQVRQGPATARTALRP